MQTQKHQPMSTKNIFLITLVAGAVAGVVAGFMQNTMQDHTDSYATFDIVECKSLSVVDDDGKSGILLFVRDGRGFLSVSDKDTDSPDYQERAMISISKAGGSLVLTGRDGMVSITAGDGVHIYDDGGGVTGALPDHSHPHPLDKEESQ